MNFSDKKQVRQFIEENDIRDIGALNKMLKNVSGVFIEQILEAEQEEHLGYDSYNELRNRRPTLETAMARKGFAVSTVRWNCPSLVTVTQPLSHSLLRSTKRTSQKLRIKSYRCTRKD